MSLPNKDMGQGLTSLLIMCRYVVMYLWYLSMYGTLTAKDHEDLRALLDPDVLHMIRISAIGLHVRTTKNKGE
jgi:hypothetical protein